MALQMKQKTLIYILVFSLFPLKLLALDINNNLYTIFSLIKSNDDYRTYYIAEDRINLKGETENTEVFSQIRFYLGESQQYFSVSEAFFKYTGPYLHITFGKSYFEIGIPTFLNPLKFRRTINFLDITYNYEGFWNFKLDIFPTYFSSISFFVFPSVNNITNTDIGIWGTSSDLGFDISIGAFRTKEGNYRIFGSTKFDLVAGISLNTVLYLSNEIKDSRTELDIQLDYNLFENKLFLLGEYYYNGLGNDKYEEYVKSIYTPLKARHYLMFMLAWNINEFRRFNTWFLSNLNDGSKILCIWLEEKVTDILKVSPGILVPLGPDESEFSSREIGIFSTFIRLEGYL